ncbi:hypothetical protein TrVE_jg1572 [Triparma verrucosa]|uniref:Uncharacterized protein n=1 Tax=Triparma verrucosa TaxID=1606542 RepID=A0A9W7FLA7_9STRA|nr:hypothetical protein TrVE_jg1572 [Triparma verrucosa]
MLKRKIDDFGKRLAEMMNASSSVIDVPQSTAEPPEKPKRGRPLGSKNKKRASSTEPPEKPKRGRPLGSKNKKRASSAEPPDNTAFDPEEDLKTRETNLQRVYANQPILDIPDLTTLPKIPVLPQSERDFIARCLQLEYREGQFDWPEDWSGNLTLFFKEITVKAHDSDQTIIVSFAEHYQDHWRVLVKFFALVIKLEDMPAEAIRILTYAAVRESMTTTQKYGFMVEAVQMTLFDKKVLQEDSWQTKPTKLTVDEGGNVVRVWNKTDYIGRSVYWVRSEATVIAFITDEEIGDLWKVKWVNWNSSCDLDRGELIEGLKAWDKHLLRVSECTKYESSSSLSSPPTSATASTTASTTTSTCPPQQFVQPVQVVRTSFGRAVQPVPQAQPQHPSTPSPPKKKRSVNVKRLPSIPHRSTAPRLGTSKKDALQNFRTFANDNVPSSPLLELTTPPHDSLKFRLASAKTTSEKSHPSEFSLNEKVFATWMKSGKKLYPGIIFSVNGDGTYGINYDDGDVDMMVMETEIRKDHRSHNLPPLPVGTLVRAFYDGLCDGPTGWFNGVIKRVSIDLGVTTHRIGWSDSTNCDIEGDVGLVEKWRKQYVQWEKNHFEESILESELWTGFVSVCTKKLNSIKAPKLISVRVNDKLMYSDDFYDTKISDLEEIISDQNTLISKLIQIIES